MNNYNCRNKIKKNYDELKEIVTAHKVLGEKIVCTVGTWDMLHIGHLRYLEKVKKRGDILLIGVDSDKGVKLYKKNPLRPIIPQKERMEMLSYQGFIDYITLIEDIDEKGVWQLGLIKATHPDIFVATTEAYPSWQLKQIREHCGKLTILKYEARGTSTSKIIEKTFKRRLKHILSNLKH